MRKWFPGTCGECGSDTGYWEDIVEGPLTLEQYEYQNRPNPLADLFANIYGPAIKEQLEQDGLLERKDYFGKLNIASYKTTVSRELLKGIDTYE